MTIFFTVFWLFEPQLYQSIFASTSLEGIKKRDFLIVAHRGGGGLAPENTLASIKKSINTGADMIEVDVHLTKDNEVVIFHDETVNRTTNGEGKVHEMTLAELKELDAGSWFDGAYAGETVPTLDEVLKLIDGQVQCLIEIKSKEHLIYEGFAEKIVDIINANGAKTWSIVQSYEEEYLETAYAYDPEIKIKKIIMGEESSHILSFFIESKEYVTGRNKHHYLETLNPHYSSLSQRRVHKIKARGYKVITYPVNERKEMIKMLNMGVDGIITDYPDRLVKIREELNELDRL